MPISSDKLEGVTRSMLARIESLMSQELKVDVETGIVE